MKNFLGRNFSKLNFFSNFPKSGIEEFNARNGDKGKIYISYFKSQYRIPYQKATHPRPPILPKNSFSRTANSTELGRQAQRNDTRSVCQEKNQTGSRKSLHILKLSVTDDSTIILTMFKEIKGKCDIPLDAATLDEAMVS